MFCKNCGKEIADKAVVCTNCGCEVKAKKSKKKLFIIIGVVFVIMCIAIGSSSTETTGGTDATVGSGENKVTETTVPDEFSGKKPVSFSATVEDNIIGVPEVKVHTENKTKKDIAAIQYYFIGYDVYGEEIETIFTNNRLPDDEGIKANGSSTRAWQLLDDGVKTGELYIYSVYFADGSEWGDKEASVTNIKKYGLKVNVEQ
ncbi:MAG: zinc ribbon domain-containing protein [Clostridia bacterium]|nr:zinc ribbon domain-containing protein [Clostridia bacterium]